MKLSPTIKTIIWDLDGTLLDSFGIYEDILAQLLPTKGVVVPPRAAMLKNFHGSIEESLGGILNFSPEELTAFVKEFLEVDNNYIKEVHDHLFPDALAFAKKAHQNGIRQMIVTNRPHGMRRGNGSPRNIVQNSDLREYIDYIVCGDESEHRKPKKEVLSGVEYDPVTTVVIGDQFVDAQLAHNLGATGILVNRQGEVPHLEQMADGWESHITIVPSLDEVQL